MKHALFAITLALSACNVLSAPNASSTVATTIATVQLKSTTALTLAVRAYNFAESAATDAVKSPHFSVTDKANIGDAIHKARVLRDRAVVLVAQGQDATAIIEQLNTALTDVAALTGDK